jgi:hypothetical protein
MSNWKNDSLSIEDYLEKISAVARDLRRKQHAYEELGNDKLAMDMSYCAYDLEESVKNIRDHIDKESRANLENVRNIAGGLLKATLEGKIHG